VLSFGFWAAFRLACAAAVAAAAAGVIMWRWGASDADAARAFLLTIPLLGDDLLVRVRSEINAAWLFNLTAGAVTGAPYKIYAVEAGAAGLHPLVFWLASFGARLTRFALTMGLAAAGAGILKYFGAARWAPLILAAAWAGIYGAYMMIRVNA